MESVSLNGAWTLRHGPQREPAAALAAPEPPADFATVAAEVPGNVELDLQRAGRLPAALELGDHIYRLRALENHQWWYSRSFAAPAVPAGHDAELVFDGLDCLATVWLNGRRIGTADNMLVPHRFDVRGTLREGENELVVALDSAVLAGRRQETAPGDSAMTANWESLPIRKAAHMYGWDICPRIVSAGLWKDVRLEFPAPTRFRSVYFATRSVDAAARKAEAVLDWDFRTDVFDIDAWTMRFTLARGGRTAFERSFPVVGTHGRAELSIPDADFWWPRGAGEAALYDARLELADGDGRVRAEKTWRAGLRTVRLERTELLEDGKGEFVFVVNGRRVFIQGTNWVPLDALHSRDRQHLAHALALAADLNCNMLRCWGGNVYESDAFFERCDELGLLVWQDFSFACALYPQTPAFHAAAAQEAEAVIRRLRNHACLALWAGNNEIDTFYVWAKPRHDPNVDDRLSREVLAAAVRRHDPWREYLPSSPYLSPAVWARGAGEALRPEDHLWGPRDDYKGPFYAEAKALFASETGYHGCPSRSTLERLLPPADLWPLREADGAVKDAWFTHAVRPLPRVTDYNYRIPLMAAQVRLLFGEEPDTLDDFVFASQFSQAEAKKFFIERFRSDFARAGGRTGILWWNLRDGWPVVSDAVVDYYGTRKLAYFAIRRVQADVAVMAGEAEGGVHPVWAVNMAPRPAAGQATAVRLADDEGGREAELFSTPFRLPAGGRVRVGTVPATPQPACYEFRWHAGGLEGEGRNHYLAGPRPFAVKQCRIWYAALGLRADP